MESVIECIIFLRSIPWFEDIRDDFLARIAENVDEQFVKANVEIVKQGDLGDFMYIIKKGKVSVHADGQELTKLESGAFFGEMAILDAEPRSASITTTEDSVFYKLSHEALVEAMGNEVNVSLGIVRALSRRLRTTNIRNTKIIGG